MKTKKITERNNISLKGNEKAKSMKKNIKITIEESTRADEELVIGSNENINAMANFIN